MLRRRYFPTFFTALHLLAGCIAIPLVFNQHFETATYVLISACIFDLLDGFLERIITKPSLPRAHDVHILADIGSVLFQKNSFTPFSLFQSASLLTTFCD
jgi:hypothetical protein